VNLDAQLYPRTLKKREREAVQLVSERPGMTLAQVQGHFELSDAAMRRLESGLRGQVRFELPPLPEPEELAPRITWRRDPPPEVLAARAAEAAQERVLAAVVQPRIEGHIATYRMALDAVDKLHQRIADGTNIDLLASTRWAAMWQLGGRTLGFARALVTLAEAGMGDEAMPVARGVHEASRMLEAVTNMNEKDIAVRWVADDDDRYPKPYEVRAAIERVEILMNDMRVAAGEEPVPTTRHLSAALYRRMSGVTHNRRYATANVVDPYLRRMARGRHAKARGRAAAVRYAGSVVNEAVSQTGVCLVSFLGERAGQEWMRTTLRPTIDTFAAIDADQPLDDDSITAAARAARTS
jgi:hypothetical protein